MARYNTVAPAGQQSGAGTIATPNQGLFTTLTGTAPYTVTLANPVLFTGSTQTFWNQAGGVVTLSTPNGSFSGPGSTGGATITMPNNTILQIISDGTNYITVQDDGSTFSATTGTFSSTLNADGNFTVNTNKFVVTATSGNTSVAGTLGVTDIASFSSTSHMVVPVGTIAQRPGSPAQGMVRYNTDMAVLETYTGTGWRPNGGFKNVDVSNTSYTASVWDCCWVYTNSSASTVTLPASPVKGDTVRFFDLTRTFSARNLTVSRNGKPIQGDAADLTVNTNGAAFDLVFYDNTYGWRIFSI